MTTPKKQLNTQSFLDTCPRDSGYHWNSTKAQIWDCIDMLIHACKSGIVEKISKAIDRAVLRFQAYMPSWSGIHFVNDILWMIEKGELV